MRSARRYFLHPGKLEVSRLETKWITDLDRGEPFKVPEYAYSPASGMWATFESIERLGPDDEWLTFVCFPISDDVGIVPGRVHDSDLEVTVAEEVCEVPSK